MKTEKTCKVCKTTKKLSSFSKQGTVKDGHKSTCKECLRVISVRLYRKRQAKYAYTKKTELVRSMGGGCADCGLSVDSDWPIVCFDFHHIGEKKFSISKLLRSAKNHNGPDLVKELSACVVLCSNCHKRRHHIAGTLGMNTNPLSKPLL